MNFPAFNMKFLLLSLFLIMNIIPLNSFKGKCGFSQMNKHFTKTNTLFDKRNLASSYEFKTNFE